MQKGRESNSSREINVLYVMQLEFWNVLRYYLVEVI